MKQRLTNTWKHALVGAIVGIILGLIVLVLNAETFIGFLAIVFTFYTINWEMCQWNGYRWLDSIVDFLAGNAGFYIVYLLLLHLGGYL